MARVYATRAQLVAYAPSGTAIPDDPEATRLLTSASKHVDRYGLLTAVYDVDDNGLPTDADERDAIRDATCAQALYWLQTGGEGGAADQWASVGIGSVNLSRGNAGGATSPAQTLAPQAETELRVAGLLPGSISTY